MAQMSQYSTIRSQRHYRKFESHGMVSRLCEAILCFNATMVHSVYFPRILSPRLWLASYRINFERAYYSDLLRSQAKGLVVYDIHNYITCTINGRSTVVDITFPAALGDYGFPVTASWSEGRDFILCCAPDEVQEIRSIDEADHMKRQWLQALNPGDAAIIRERAIQELMLSARQS